MEKIILIFAFSLTANFVFGGEEIGTEKMSLSIFLQKTAKRCDVFFTVEEACAKNYSEILMAETISVSSFPTNIDSFVFHLTNSITNLMVISDKSNSHIYHIVDTRLLGLKGYAMEKPLDSVNYQGDAKGFIKCIAEKAAGLSSQDISFGGPIVLNEDTLISIDAKNITVRNALSNGVNLNGYRRIIWTSSTLLEKVETPVKYMGMKPPE